MKRESFVFYKSFADAIRCLPDEERLKVYDAVCGYALEGDAGEVDGIVAAVLCLIKPQIDANNKRYENGLKGGKANHSEAKADPKPNQNETKTEPKRNQSDP